MRVLVVLSAVLASCLAQYYPGAYPSNYHGSVIRSPYTPSIYGGYPGYTGAPFRSYPVSHIPAPYTPGSYISPSRTILQRPVAPFIKSAPALIHRAVAPSYAATRPIAIVRSSSLTNFDGSFNSDFQSEDGISVASSGSIKNPGTQDEAQVMTGSFSYTAPDGTPITTNWYADETGFHAEGAHLPQPQGAVPTAVQPVRAY